jgi:hypothetical protein
MHTAKKRAVRGGKLGMTQGVWPRWPVVITLALTLGAGSTWFMSSSGAAPAAPLSFAAERALGQEGRNASSPFLRSGPRGRLYAVWTEDDPAQSTESRRDPAQHQHKHPGMFTFTMRVALMASSGDGGKTWSPARKVNSTMEAIQGEENEPRIAFAPDGRALVVWSTPNEQGDKSRANVRFAMEDGHGGFTPSRSLNEIKDTARFPTVELAPDRNFLVAWIDRRVDSPATRALYVTRLGPTGRELGRSYKVAEDVCECCRLGVAFADGGRTVYVAHRHVTREQIRNHVLLKSTDGGATFGPPVTISDDGWQTGCPHSGPSLAVDHRGQLHVTWFTLGRVSTDAGVYYAVSKDGGRRFTPRQLVQANTAPEVLHARLAIGRDGTVYFAWDNLDAASKSQIFVRSLAPDGTTWSPVQQLSQARENANRPVLSVSDQKLHVAWTESDGERSQIVMRSAPLAR